MHTRKTAYAAEFLGTFLLVLFIGLILASNSNAGLGTTNFAVIGLLHAFVLAMLIASLGAVSSAHFNPAVTIALRSLGKISATDAAIYIVAQLAGAVCAALVVKLVLTNPADATNYGAPAVNKTFVSGNAGAAAAELIGTFVLVWAILATAVNPRGDHAWAPWMIGATLGLAVMAIGPITGAGLNPARAFGPALVANAFGGAGSFVLVYVLAPIAGALLAGVGYRLIVLERRSEVRAAEPMQEPLEEFALAN